MSKHELFDAYISKEINRRTFIQGLTALGVSAGVAASYAVALQPVASASASCDMYNMYDFYDLYDLYCDAPPPPDSPAGGSKRRRRRRKKKKKGNKKNN